MVGLGRQEDVFWLSLELISHQIIFTLSMSITALSSPIHTTVHASDAAQS
jgi:hypothetical protein